MTGNPIEISAFILYMLLMLGIGVFFMIKAKGGSSEYFLGGRQMGSWVTALSAQASDMSGWLLMGLPGSLLAAGMGQTWIAIGLLIGTYLNWLIVAKRLRKFSEFAEDSITIPQFLQNRFKTKNLFLRLVCAVVLIVFFTLYVASAFKACGELFQSLLGVDYFIALTIGAIIIVAYTFMGGYRAVCWTDFFQSLLMLAALLIVPILAVTALKGISADMIMSVPGTPKDYMSFFPEGTSVQSVLSGLAWGLGYFGMPHIIVRFMAIKDEKLVKDSRRIAVVWVILALGAAVAVGIFGRAYLHSIMGNEAFAEFVGQNKERVFIEMVRYLTPAFITGILLSGVLAAAMSTADSQLLVAASAVTNDVYQPLVRKNASDKELMWVSRIVVVIIAIIAYVIAAVDPNNKTVMGLVSNAWAGFGASFGPAILLSLFWRRVTYPGVITGIIAGFASDILWLMFLSVPTGIYELLPAFVFGFIVTVAVSLITKAPSKEVTDMFDKVAAK